MITNSAHQTSFDPQDQERKPLQRDVNEDPALETSSSFRNESRIAVDLAKHCVFEQ
jgi:hypothetical protein